MCSNYWANDDDDDDDGSNLKLYCSNRIEVYQTKLPPTAFKLPIKTFKENIIILISMMIMFAMIIIWTANQTFKENIIILISTVMMFVMMIV